MNIKDIKHICKNVGFDGASYFCELCGKSGFENEGKVVSHLGHCPNRAVKKGILPTATANTTLGDTATTATTTTTTQDSKDTLQVPPTLMRELQRLVVVPIQQQLSALNTKVTNENVHLMAMNNLNQTSDTLLGIPKSWWIIGAIVAGIFFFIGRETKVCHCSTSDYDYGYNERSSRGRSVGSSLAYKAFNRAVDFGLGKILK
jgi:hypothetical protein